VHHLSLQGPIFAELGRAVIGCDVGFKGYLRVRGVGYRFQLDAGDVKADTLIDEHAASPHLHVSAGLSHPLVVPINPEFTSAMTRKFRMLRLRSKGLNTLTQTLSSLRNMRPPDVYKGKGIRYRKDTVMKKEGKKKKV
jgi:large subunit ribosomal protein L6